ncbi:MAG: glycosyltransferase family 2 protein [Bacteroidota bacterium]
MESDISIIIPTFNGRQKIKFTIQSILNQTMEPLEIIVVIDGSTDGTKEILAQEYGNEINVINQENQGRACTRNVGAQVANGSLLLFVDDDIELEPDAVKQHLLHHRSHQRSLLVGALFLKDVVNSSDFHSYRQFIENSWYSNLPDYPQPMAEDNLFVSAANLSVPKNLFNELNGFDSSLTDCEDFELGIRAKKAGVDIFFSKKIRGRHNDSISCQQYINRRKAYEAAQSLLNEKNKFEFPSNKWNDPGAFKKIIYYILSFDFWVFWVDHSLATWIPRSMRYKFYSAIIWSKSHYYRN